MATTGVPITPAPVAAAPPPLALAPAPSLASKAPSAAPSPGPATPGSVTSKEWVIPPRPKPGRKPATDTPPTKRKAQNRAAQRAFRERRAARVCELEEQIKDIEDSHDNRVAGLNEQIDNLSREVEQCREEMNWWRDRSHALEKEVSVERSAKEALVREFRSSLTGPNAGKSSTIPDSVPLPPRTRPSTRSSRMEDVQPTSPDHPDHSRKEGHENVPLGCSNCSSTHCQCIEDAFAMPVDSHESSHSKHPPHGVGSANTEPDIKPDPEEMEIDFTSRFAAPPAQPALGSNTANSNSNSNNNNNASSPPVDPCGFCQDGTPCICAEMAAQEQSRGQRNSFENPRLAPIQSLSQFTPPPSDGDVRSEVTLPPISQATNPCANGPGTCAQCLADPRSTLFCKTLAASRNAPATTTTNRNNPGPVPALSAAPMSASPSLTLTCADTFTTLSRHPNFSRASDDISTWLPKLNTLPNPRDLPVVPDGRNRAAMEVEAASVMGVLRYFDRRFAEK
ncbi:hypothetical protein N7474_000232 [Penicillium riverlandense]|uniref:uncharacterized protein n=1 Tax=Penicillium riverlandense TaxID=1903569 RepID=UPI0025480056|nr:uncharacterized protein N7474_000232 [Penicillium riverlandense]KAJ5831921.1 hypothetical protein N7474_000232 [Penicillium riverlandense]